ncbi:hypothetical protein F4808DRAFT_40686 [Astrocystis sublimbata]|nr:hypothetical protein F4808DRAFT_40686 [Astrocystis sublimbata]
MSSRRNGDIRGFFKSGSASISQARRQPASSPPTSSLSPPPPVDLPSSPRTPPKSAPRSRHDEIKGSDDSEDDSDDSLGSITGALGYRSGPAAHRRDPNVLSTPQAKRIASGTHRSPLTLQPKKHKFDMKALMNHSRDIERTEASFQKADALIAQTGKSSDISDDSDAENDPKGLEEAACTLFVADEDEDGKGDKIRMAFKRSKDDETSSRKHCYFFRSEQSSPKPGKNVFPRKTAAGRWKCLSQSDARRRAFMMGLPHTFLARGATLPDELYLWILDEICREQNAELRRQYISLTGFCEDNTGRLVDDTTLYTLLERIGGPTFSRETKKVKCTSEVRPEYLERDWSQLITFLQLLNRLAPDLQTASAVCAVQLLLRLSLDPVVAAVVREHYIRTITALVSNLAKSRSTWNTACEAICSYVYKNIDDPELKVTALLSIPSSTTHLVDLRRRIAAESLFHKPGLGRKPIDRHLSFEKIRDRLDADDFKATNRVDFDFDFEQLRALATLLDIVIDRGEFMHTSSSSAIPPATNGSSTTTKSIVESTAAASSPVDDEQQFNANVDELAARVKLIHDKIRDKASRKNVKLSLLGLEKRLRYAVRTRPLPRREIFAFDDSVTARKGKGMAEEAGPKQRDFMRQWALNRKKKEVDERMGKEEVEEVVGFETTDFLEVEVEVESTGSGRPRRSAKGVSVAVG